MEKDRNCRAVIVFTAFPAQIKVIVGVEVFTIHGISTRKGSRLCNARCDVLEQLLFSISSIRWSDGVLICCSRFRVKMVVDIIVRHVINGEASGSRATHRVDAHVVDGCGIITSTVVVAPNKHHRVGTRLQIGFLIIPQPFILSAEAIPPIQGNPAIG